MTSSSERTNAQIFINYAGTNINRWQEAIGQEVVHIKEGKGTIIKVHSGGETIYITIAFEKYNFIDNLIGFRKPGNYVDMTLPPNAEKHIQRQKHIANRNIENTRSGTFGTASRYINHCWHCKASIDSNSNTRCNQCRMFWCNVCGACFCHKS